MQTDSTAENKRCTPLPHFSKGNRGKLLLCFCNLNRASFYIFKFQTNTSTRAKNTGIVSRATR